MGDDNLDNLSKIHKECFDEDIIITFPNTDIVPYIVEGKIVAYLAVRRLSNNHYHIYNVCTGMKDRNKGYMTNLLTRAINNIILKSDCYPIQEHSILITLDVDKNSPAIHLYNKFGFKANFNHESNSEIRMELIV